MTHWTELVELYEYKVADILAGHAPRGGKYALQELRTNLINADLDPPLLRRFMQMDKQYREWRSGKGLFSISTLEPVESPVPEEPLPMRPLVSSPDTPEARAWRELRLLAWHAGLRSRLHLSTRDLRHEAERPTLRVLYTVTENAERRLKGIKESFPVPMAKDPLVSLGNAEVVHDITESFAELLLSSEGRQQVKAALSQVIERPFQRHPDEEALQKQLDLIQQERLSVVEREEVMSTLKQKYPQVSDPRDAPLVRDAARRLQHILNELLQGGPDGSQDAVPQRCILFASEAPACLPQADHGADEVIIHLGGEANEVRWRNRLISWQPSGVNWQVQFKVQEGAEGRDHLLTLRPDVPASERSEQVSDPGLPLQVFLSGDYLLLRVSTPPEEILSWLAVQARAVAVLTNPNDDYFGMRFARAIAQQFRDGRININALGPESGGRYSSAPPDKLILFARKGLNKLSQLLRHSPQPEVTQTIKSTAKTLGISPEVAQGMHQLLHRATFNPERLTRPSERGASPSLPHLGSTSRFHSFRLEQQPMTVQLPGNRALTIRPNYRREWVLLMPGQPALVLEDLLVLHLGDLDLLMIRHGSWVALAAQTSSTLNSLRETVG